MSMTQFELSYNSDLERLANEGKITEYQFRHFRNRGIQTTLLRDEYEELGKIFPEAPVYVAQKFVQEMKVPYLATSFLGASASPDNKGPYVFKIPGEKGGGVERLTGGQRRVGDNVFASLHRILIGYKANMVSADNFMGNRSQLWNYEFFAQHLNKKLREELADLAEKRLIKKYPYHVIVARSDDTFKRLKILEERETITALDTRNEAEVIFLTNRAGFDYASKVIKELDKVHYIETGKEFDMLQALIELRKRYKIDMMLNDGGRQMSNGVRKLGLLGEERITKEPYPGKGVLPQELDPKSFIDIDGAGLDGNELQTAINVYSKKINGELASIYLCQLDESKIF